VVNNEKGFFKMAKISKRRKEALRDKLYKRDGRRCHYCRIKEENFNY